MQRIRKSSTHNALPGKSLPHKSLAGGLMAGLWATGASAHEGHGLIGTHWHATDVWGFVALGVVVLAAIWLWRR